jgi:peptidoglycan/xylan/chitin deacetylase (PgdA/CDA1 family)
MIERISNKWRRLAIEQLARRDFRLNGNAAYVSFTFDDFPRTALTAGGRILLDHDARGTYFLSFELLDTDSVSGRIASYGDLEALLSDGHELGCHTFGHLDGSKVPAVDFERSIAANRTALANSPLDAQFHVFAYPLNGPAVSTKRIAGNNFLACRGGGQTFNRDLVDLNLLKAYFVDQRTWGNLDEITRLIDENAAAGGWLIFATHDVVDNPSAYGCTPAYFEQIVRLSRASGARLLPMTSVCRELGVAH